MEVKLKSDKEILDFLEKMKGWQGNSSSVFYAILMRYKRRPTFREVVSYAIDEYKKEDS